MTSEQTFKGSWWPISDPNNSFSGTLTYLENESLMLDLIGTFPEDKAKNPFGVTINGVSHLGEPISMFNAFQTNSEISFTQEKAGISTFRGTLAIKGKHFSSVDQVSFNSLVFRPTHFEEWLWMDSIENKSFSNGVKVTYRRPTFNAYEINDTLQISFFYSLSPITVGNHVSLDATPLVRIIPSTAISFRGRIQFRSATAGS